MLNHTFQTTLQVTATDLDSGENGRVTYSIIKGDNDGQFTIDEDTGYLSVANKLDRESVSSYVLEVLAKDHGIPVLSRQVMVNIEISDANDNPPLFSQNNYTTVVQVSELIEIYTGIIHIDAIHNFTVVYVFPSKRVKQRKIVPPPILRTSITIFVDMKPK